MKFLFAGVLSLFRFIHRRVFVPLLKRLYFKVYYTDKELVKLLEDKNGYYNSSAITYQRYQMNTTNTEYNNKVKITSHKDYLKYIRFKNIEGAILHSPATTVSLIVGILSFLLPFFLVFTSPFSTKLLAQILCGVLLTALTFFALVPYLKYYVRQLPLKDFAFFIRNVYTESEMISYISYRIWKACNKFMIKSDWLNEKYVFSPENNGGVEVKSFLISKDEIQHNSLKKEGYYFPDIKNDAGGYIKNGNSYGLKRLKQIKENFGTFFGTGETPNYKLKDKVRENISHLNYAINELEQEMQQISVLINHCSERLRIPEVELAEHFFQFSPSMYWSWIKKVSHNIDVVSDLLYHTKFPGAMRADSSDDLLYDQVKALLYQIDRFLERNRKFMDYQCQNIAFNDLHDDIIDIASSPSSSEPVKIYIRLLSRVHGENATVEKPDNLTPVSIERLLYVHHKRKVHTGLDLHRSAQRILEKINRPGKLPATVPLLYNVDFNDLVIPFKIENFHSYLKAIQLAGTKGSNDLNMLKFFHSSAVIYIDSCRNEMGKRFKIKSNVYFTEWTSEIDKLVEKLKAKGKKDINKKKVFIITFGYSKAVRQVIKNCIIGHPIEEYSRLIIFSSENESKIDSRQIKYHLTEQPEKKAKNVLVSNPDFIIPLIDENVKILILMGAEVFDKDNITIRTHAYKDCLLRFLKGAISKMSGKTVSGTDYPAVPPCIDVNNETNKKNLKVIVCAESYKRYEKLSGLVDLFDDQYENIEIYDSSLITDVIHD